MSQRFDLGTGSFFMLCRILKYFFSPLFTFCIIKMELAPKSKFKETFLSRRILKRTS